MSDKEGIILEGLDIVDVIRITSKKKDKFLALALQELEERAGLSQQQFKVVRKVLLDMANDLHRSELRALLGDIEIDIYN